MSVRVGDVLFLQSGRPAVVVERKIADNKLVSDDDRDKVRTMHRHGYINGLSIDERKNFDAILDQVKQIEEPQKRVDELQQKVTELAADPRNLRLTRYLTAEMAHLMHSSGIRPRTFEIDADKVR